MELLNCESKHGVSSDKPSIIDYGEEDRKHPCDACLLVTNSGKTHDVVVSCFLSPAIMLSLAFGILLTINYVSMLYSCETLTI